MPIKVYTGDQFEELSKKEEAATEQAQAALNELDFAGTQVEDLIDSKLRMRTSLATAISSLESALRQLKELVAKVEEIDHERY